MKKSVCYWILQAPPHSKKIAIIRGGLLFLDISNSRQKLGCNQGGSVFFIGYLKHQIKKLNRTQRGLACYWIFQTTSKKLNSKQRVHIVIGYFTLPNSTEKLDCNLGRPVFYWIHQTQDKKTKLHLERACLLLDISDHLQKTK